MRLKTPVCTCAVVAGLSVMAGHLCPVHYRESFVAGQHPLHEQHEPPRSAGMYFIASGFGHIGSTSASGFLDIDDSYSTHGD